jgi:tetratricopeptide (TPR) repeat protein
VREPVLGRDAPASWDAIVNLGVLALEAGDHDQAAANFERALELRAHVLGASHPDLVFPLTGLGVVALRNGQLAEAERRLLRAVAIVFDNNAIGRLEAVDALASLCDVYGGQERFADAAELAQRGLDALADLSEPSPRSVGFLQAHRGRAALHLGDAELAVELLEAAVRVEAVPMDFHFTLARALDAAGREPERALQLAREALVAASGNPERVDMIEDFIRERTPSRNTAPR